MAINFDGFSLQDSNYITSEINYRSSPVIDLNISPISRGSGIKVTNREFAERKISLKGSILGSSFNDLQSRIDNFNKNVVRKDEGLLEIDSGRTINAVVASSTIEDPHYTQSYVPFEVEFVTTEPFFSGVQQTVNWNINSGTTSQDLAITISGTAYALPVITYTAPAGAGYTTTSGIIVSYPINGEYITWSGVGASTTLGYGSTVQFDYANEVILQDSAITNPAGTFSRWNPQDTTFTITFSGTALGGTLAFSYSPRYL